MGKVNEAVWAERRELVRRCSESGLSAAEFCRREGISYGHLAAWKKRLRGESSHERAFAELLVEKSGAEKDKRERAVHVEIALPGGAVVRVFAQADASLVRTIVEAVRSC